MFMKCSTRCRMACFVLALFAPFAMADEEPAAVRKARQLLEPEQAVILFVAHPAGKFIDAEFEGSRAKGKDHILTYKFNFDNVVGNRCATTIAFTFDEDGIYKDCRSTSRQGVAPPFIAADAVLDFIKARMRDDPKLKDNKLVQELLDEADAKEILKKYLRLKQGANDPDDVRRMLQLFLSLKKN